MGRNTSAGDTVIIKKYANRRLYDTGSSSYITLDDLARMTRDGTDFQVLDAKTGEDITHSILTQIIMEEEASGGEPLLPLSFLRQIISMYGNSMRAMVPPYLEASMANFQANQAKLREAFETGMQNNPFAKLAETNLAMMKAAAQAFMPGGLQPRPPVGDAAPPASPDGAGAPATPATGDELAELRRQMAELQRRLDQLDQ